MGRHVIGLRWAYFVVCALALVAYPLAGAGTLAAAVVMVALAGVVVVAIAVGMRVNRLRPRAPWYWLLGAMTCSLGASIVYFLVGVWLPPSFPGPADLLWLAGYVAHVVSLALFLRAYSQPAKAGVAVDQAIITLGLASVSFVFFIEPFRAAPGLPFDARLVSMAYPTMDVVMLSVLVRGLLVGRLRQPATAFQLSALGVQVTADAIYQVLLASNGYHPGLWVDSLWMLGYVLFGAASLWPARPALPRPGSEKATSVRFLTLVGAALLPPLMVVYVEFRGGAHGLSTAVLAALGIVLFVLVARRLEVVTKALFDAEAARTALAAALEEAQHARHEAEEANAAKARFLSRASHELRTPLNAIMGLTQLLQLGDLGSEADADLEGVMTASTHLLVLVDDLLEIGSVGSGQARLGLEPVDIDAEIALAARSARPLMAGKVLHAECADGGDGGDHAWAAAEPTRLRQVLLNLLSNAAHYAGDGAQVTVRRTRDGERVRIIVEDDGAGLDDGQLEEAFSPFERFGNEVSGIPGTGLGLTLTQCLVEGMGGSITAESLPGHGVRFEFTLSALADPADAEAADAAPVPAPSGDGHPGGEPGNEASGCVLYIEDVRSNIELVARICELRPGLVLATATHGALGLEIAGTHRPGLVLLDLELPDMPGEAVLRRLRADDATCLVPVVVVTGHADPRRCESLRRSGAQECLTKPFSVEAMLGLLDRYLGGGSARTGREPAGGGTRAREGGRRREP